jgi:hypothetical protein
MVKTKQTSSNSLESDFRSWHIGDMNVPLADVRSTLNLGHALDQSD